MFKKKLCFILIVLNYVSFIYSENKNDLLCKIYDVEIRASYIKRMQENQPLLMNYDSYQIIKKIIIENIRIEERKKIILSEKDETEISDLREIIIKSVFELINKNTQVFKQEKRNVYDKYFKGSIYEKWFDIKRWELMYGIISNNSKEFISKKFNINPILHYWKKGYLLKIKALQNIKFNETIVKDEFNRRFNKIEGLSLSHWFALTKKDLISAKILLTNHNDKGPNFLIKDQNIEVYGIREYVDFEQWRNNNRRRRDHYKECFNWYKRFFKIKEGNWVEPFQSVTFLHSGNDYLQRSGPKWLSDKIKKKLRIWHLIRVDKKIINSKAEKPVFSEIKYQLWKELKAKDNKKIWELWYIEKAKENLKYLNPFYKSIENIFSH